MSRKNKKYYKISKEQKFIRNFLKPLTYKNQDKAQLSDDAALCKINRDHIVISTDTIVKGVHFVDNEIPENIAAKAIRTAISDIIAKGVPPKMWMLNIIGKKNVFEKKFLQKFIKKIQQEQKKWNCYLIGGDTVVANVPLTITVTVIGESEKNKIIRRKGAKPNHKIYVTGTIGDATLGLKLAKIKQNSKKNTAKNSPEYQKCEKLSSKYQKFLLKRYQIPQIRAEICPLIIQYASASMDISDGLAGDLELLCEASGVSAHINIDTIPLSDAAREYVMQAKEENPMIALITGGDDYEILCTVPEKNIRNFENHARKKNIPITQIGTIIQGKESPIFRYENGEILQIKKLSWSHIL